MSAITVADRARSRLGPRLDRLATVVGKRWATFGDADLPAIEAETEEALSFYEGQGWLDDPLSVHVEKRVPRVVDARVLAWRQIRYERLVVDAGWRPHPDEPGAERWFQHDENRLAVFRLFEHQGAPRPWVICVHGTGMGANGVDFRGFEVPWLHRRLGLNVALPVLPLSAGRRRRGEELVQFPTIKQVQNLLALLGTASELRALVGILRGRGAPEITVTGVSLGGYVTGMAAATVPGVDRVIAGIPASDFQSLILHHVPPEERDEYRRPLELGRQLHRVVSPLDLDPQVPPGQRFVYAGWYDEMVPLEAQAVPLWEAWGRPEHLWAHGSHVTLVNSKPVRHFLRQCLSTPITTR